MPAPSNIHKNTLIYILGISNVTKKNDVHVNVVHITVEFKWNVLDLKKLLQ